jgi:enterochelin esterase-like enzyme
MFRTEQKFVAPSPPFGGRRLRLIEPRSDRYRFFAVSLRGERIKTRSMLTKYAFSPSIRCLGTITLLALLVPAVWAAESYTEKPGNEGDGKFTVGPEYKIDPDLTDRGNPKGKSFEFTMALADSKIFKGDDATLEPQKKEVRKERKIYVYVPAAYQDGTKAPLLIIHDGPGQLKLVRNALDNLNISKDPARKLPPFIAIAVENGGNDGKNSERGLEYDTMSDRLARFIHGEVLPAVLQNADLKAAYPKLAFTDNPWGRAVMGCSSGGAAALSMGWFRPDLFRRLIAYSGTFVDQQDDDAAEEAKYPLGAWEYHSSMKLIEKSEKKPLRIFTHVSENDLRAKDSEETYHNWVMAGERTAAALQAKGYNHRFVFSLASRHCDGRVFEQTLADTLVWTWRGYHAD